MRRLFRFGVVIGLVGLFGVGSVTPASYAAGPDPNAVYITSISYGGSGCPQGTVGQSISDDRSVFTLIFDSFVASTGPGVPRSESRKTCDVDLGLHAPDGWSWAVLETTSRGYVQLPAGVRGETSIEYGFRDGNDDRGGDDDEDGGDGHGEHDRNGASLAFAGPVAKDYVNAAKTPPLKINWSRCGGVNHLVIGTQVSLRAPGNPSPQAQITLDSLDGKIQMPGASAQHGFHVVWRRCA